MATGLRIPSAAPSPGEHGRDRLLEIEQVSRSIRDPAAKLRYLRTSLEHRPRLADRVSGQATPSDAGRAEHPARANSFPRVLSLLAVASATAAVFGAASSAFQGQPQAAVTPAKPATAPVAEALPRLPAGIVPKAIWLVEKDDAHEQFSNGLRIDTSYAVDGPHRHYRTFVAGAGIQEPASDRPVGIVFHTTESDIWPLEASFNETLRDSSQRLLRYLRRERVYHYLIDRFGRVYRVVDEHAKANHAGAGAWSDGERIYLSLNNAFLGVSFETRWDAGRALPITEAQLTSGRSLTDYLRRRYEIAPEMVVGHGLISLNARKHVIGHHLDWARGFPFAAFSLPDQYQRPPVSVAFFGFSYDDSLTERMGEPWPGVGLGEQRFAAEAQAAGKSVEALRRERQDLYDRWLTEQLQDEERARAAEAGASRAKASGG
jgi:hypothetical protein